MKYFKDNNDHVFAYESEQNVKPGLIPISESEAKSLADKFNKKVFDDQLNSLGYAGKRAFNYPSIGDQLDDLFKSGAFSPEMAAKIQAIKNQFPKQ